MDFGDNILYEPLLIEKIQEEYFDLIKLYKNATRQSIFIKYYNINVLNSTVKDNILTTHDIYRSSDIKFDLYELTPLYSIQPIQNRAEDAPDAVGLHMSGTTTIITYTIKSPNLGDLITFYNPLYKANEIFRVIGIATTTSMSKNSIPYYELELEYAPLTDISVINIHNHSVYDIAYEKYILKSEYVRLINTMENIKKILVEIKKFYHNKRDIYIADDLCPAVINELISYLKQDFNNNYYRLFEEVKNPYNYYTLFKRQFYSLGSMPYSNKSCNEFTVFDLSKKNRTKVIWEQDEQPKNDIEYLLSLGRDLFSLLNSSIFEEIKRDN